MSWSLAKSGLVAKTEGMAALREWLEIWSADCPRNGLRRSLKVWLKTGGVRGLTAENEKTGDKSDLFVRLARFFRTETGQQSSLGWGKDLQTPLPWHCFWEIQCE